MYGDLGLYEVFEMREECLREFGFADAYRCSPHTRHMLGCGTSCMYGQHLR